MHLLFLRTISVYSCSSVSCSYKPYLSLRIPLCFSSFTKMKNEGRNRDEYSKRRGYTTNRRELDIKSKDPKKRWVQKDDGDRSAHTRSLESGEYSSESIKRSSNNHESSPSVGSPYGDMSTHTRSPEPGESLSGSFERISMNHESSPYVGSPYGDRSTHTRPPKPEESSSGSIKRSSKNYESSPTVGSPYKVDASQHLTSNRRLQISMEKTLSSKLRESDCLPDDSYNINDQEWPSLASSNKKTPQNGQKLREREDGSSIIHQAFSISGGSVNTSHISGSKERPSQAGSFKDNQLPQKAVGQRSSEQSEVLAVVSSFDICQTKIGTQFELKPSLHQKNREKRKEREHSKEGLTRQRLRPGMILLKNYISQSNQIMIVKKCRDLGLGTGGFYQPCYQDGKKLHLQMMCLGKNWDPETRLYEDHRPTDGTKPPIIPNEFKQLVESSIKASHALIKQDLQGKNVEDELPWMSPDICIINFYTNTGKLGLHQDRDESEESLRKGRPVVSFSIGDSAEFLYGDSRDTEEAKKVILQSGDVLIFGGKSRHVFHGVPSILPKSAPNFLTEEATLRPGRLNLTFRQY